jgi:hypothetical protein
MENAADSAKHSVVAGTAPAGALLRIRKVFVTETSNVRTFSNGAVTLEEVEAEPANNGPKIRFLDTIDTFMKVPASGAFEWHVNPSTRPIAAEKRIRGVAETPYHSQTWENTDPSIPGDEMDKEFTITGSEPVRLLKVSVNWSTPDDYDLEVYLKQPDGSLKDMGGSGGPPGAKETAYIEDAPPGDYILRVVNFAAANPAWTMKAELFGPGPDIIIGGGKEAYLLTCHKSGQFKTQKVFVDRGQRLNVGNACS